MNWNTCMRERQVKQIKPDIEMIQSLRKTSKNKMFSSQALALQEETIAAKISLSYDSARELLEAFALEKGYKIYNHVCYTAFLKEIMKLSNMGEEFDILRKMRNDLNYYGKEISVEEAKKILDRLSRLNKELQKIFKQ